MNHRLFWQDLAKAARDKKKLHALIDGASRAQVGSVRNLCYRVSHKKLKLPPRVMRRLIPHSRHLRDLGNTKKLRTLPGVKRRMKLVGGFLFPLLLPAILSLISGVGSKAISHAIGI